MKPLSISVKFVHIRESAEAAIARMATSQLVADARPAAPVKTGATLPWVLLGLTGTRETGTDGLKEKVVWWEPVPVGTGMLLPFTGITGTVVRAGPVEATSSFAAPL